MRPLMRLGGAMLATGLLLGCGSEPVETVDLGPLGDPSIAFEAPAGEPPICVSIGDDPTGGVALLLAVKELVLNPPGACGTYEQCGQLVLYAEDVENNRSAVRAIDLRLGELAEPIHDGMPDGTGAPDLLDLRVEVVRDDDTVLLDHAGDPVAATLSLITIPSCTPPS